MRNPTWTSEELILALALYFQHDRRVLDDMHRDVVALSDTLNKLPFYGPTARATGFRNANGVAMKLGNFRSLDTQNGGRGLSRGGKLDAQIWKEFSNDTARLQDVAAAIRDAATSFNAADDVDTLQEIEDEFLEGRLLRSIHVRRERSGAAAKKKKAAVLGETGALSCECCEFDFRRTYGTLGDGFAECHHTVPISKLRGRTATKLSDLAILCANCHRMIHANGVTRTVAELRDHVRRCAIARQQ